MTCQYELSCFYDDVPEPPSRRDIAAPSRCKTMSLLRLALTLQLAEVKRVDAVNSITFAKN
jgi:hypothetical protein